MHENHIHVEPPRPVALALTAALALLALFLLVETVSGMGSWSHREPAVNTITVQGIGTSNAVPDIADIQFTVTESATTVAAAQSAATDKTNAALAAVKGLGVADKDVKTLSYNVSPKYPTPVCNPGIYCGGIDSTKIIGYEVSQSIDVKVRDTGKAGDVLQKLGTLGVQNISGPNFTVDDDNGVKNEARAEAIKNAEAKAAELAKELGVHLGKVVSFNESSDRQPYPVMYSVKSAGAAMMDSVAPSLPLGQNETTVNVSVTYEIK